jgi:hypothetical protein
MGNNGCLNCTAQDQCVVTTPNTAETNDFQKHEGALGTIYDHTRIAKVHPLPRSDVNRRPSFVKFEMYLLAELDGRAVSTLSI